MKWTPMRMTL